MKVYKVNGVRFAIRKLSPRLFMDKDYLMPLTAVVEAQATEPKKVAEKETLRSVEAFKDKMKDAILKAVVYVKPSFFGKKQDIKDIIDYVMSSPDLYAYLFTLVVQHTLGQKKNFLNHFRLIKPLRGLSTL